MKGRYVMPGLYGEGRPRKYSDNRERQRAYRERTITPTMREALGQLAVRDGWVHGTIAHALMRRGLAVRPGREWLQITEKGRAALRNGAAGNSVTIGEEGA